VEIDSEGGFTSWEGNFSEFWYRAYGIQGARVSSAAPAAKPAAGRPAKLEDRGRQIQRNKEAPGKSAPKPASRSSASSKSGAAAVGDLEARILALEKERTQLEQRSAQALSAGNYKESRRLGNDLAELTSRIEKLYGEWED
jgi:hypothetical protein